MKPPDLDVRLAHELIEKARDVAGRPGRAAGWCHPHETAGHRDGRAPGLLPRSPRSASPRSSCWPARARTTSPTPSGGCTDGIDAPDPSRSTDDSSVEVTTGSDTRDPGVGNQMRFGCRACPPTGTTRNRPSPTPARSSESARPDRWDAAAAGASPSAVVVAPGQNRRTTGKDARARVLPREQRPLPQGRECGSHGRQCSSRDCGCREPCHSS